MQSVLGEIELLRLNTDFSSLEHWIKLDKNISEKFAVLKTTLHRKLYRLARHGPRRRDEIHLLVSERSHNLGST